MQVFFGILSQTRVAKAPTSSGLGIGHIRTPGDFSAVAVSNEFVEDRFDKFDIVLWAVFFDKLASNPDTALKF